MKILRIVGLISLMLAGGMTNSRAWLTSGKVACDANQSGQIDANDQAVLGVLVMVTNVSGTFSNGNFTATPGGDFVLDLPAVPDSYVLSINPLSLPAGSTLVLPASGTISFSLTATATNFTSGNFLIANPACVQTNPPRPWLTSGRVACDANQSGQIDANDQAVLGVLVMVTNVSGTFSNGSLTATPGGDFVLNLPAVPDSYVLSINPLSLPAGSTVVLPASGAISFSLTATVTNFIGANFLIANPACVQTNQPQPWLTSGRVACDANQNGQIDANDQAVLGVLVMVTNVSGTFSNGNFTATPGGDFVLDLPAVADSYVLSINPLSLPAGSTVVLPASGTISFSLTATATNFMGGNFLIANPACVQTNQPPQTNGCCLAGSASIGGTSKKPLFTLAATVFPGCRCDEEDSGEFNVVAKGLRLQFRGTLADILNCGESVDSACGALIGSMEVQGVGTLKGTEGNNCNSGLVYFFAHIEDRSDARLADLVYFRAYDADNTTLLLISGDTANPANVSPVAVCGGNLVIGTDCCEENQGGGDHGKGKGHDNGNKGGKGHEDQSNGNKGKGDKDNKGQGSGKKH